MSLSIRIPAGYDRPWREQLLNFTFDGDDEPGDPSGVHLVLLGVCVEVYWTMHHHVSVTYSLHDNKLLIQRW